MELCKVVVGYFSVEWVIEVDVEDIFIVSGV